MDTTKDLPPEKEEGREREKEKEKEKEGDGKEEIEEAEREKEVGDLELGWEQRNWLVSFSLIFRFSRTLLFSPFIHTFIISFHISTFRHT